MPLPNKRVGGTPAPQTPPPADAGLPGRANVPGEEQDVFEEDLTGSDNRRIIDPGIWCAKCVNVVKDTSKKGDPMYVFDWVVTAGPFKGEKPRSWNSCVPQARWKLAETLRALGIPVGDDNMARFTKADCVNKPVMLKVIYDEDRETHKIDKVIAPTAESTQAGSTSPVI